MIAPAFPPLGSTTYHVQLPWRSHGSEGAGIRPVSPSYTAREEAERALEDIRQQHPDAEIATRVHGVKWWTVPADLPADVTAPVPLVPVLMTPKEYADLERAFDAWQGGRPPAPGEASYPDLLREIHGLDRPLRNHPTAGGAP